MGFKTNEMQFVDKQLERLCELATEAHTRIQKDFGDIDPVVGVSQGMRKTGVPADLMTIDCLRSGKRIILVLHDQQPGIVSYQYAYKDKDPGNNFEQIPLAELGAEQLYDWIKGYFSSQQS